MPVSKNKRKSGKVAKRVVTTHTLDERMKGVEKILQLVNRATKGRVASDKDTVLRMTVSKGL